ncbi:MAG TPA: glycosyltransferase family 2 protein [Acidobacteriaceae bacterium]|nr:glycosyltransferase family 2 protein [Acidobacteriaceae bacterium]
MRKTLSVAIITRNEESNLERTLGAISWADEIVIVDSGSSDRTQEIARRFHARFFEEEWKGFARQKNSALDKCTSDWVLSLDADEAPSDQLAKEVWEVLHDEAALDGYSIPRRNLFLGRWIRFGGFYPDPKLRLFRRGSAEFERRPVHEKVHFVGKAGLLKGDLVHYAYPTLGSYIEHMDRYSTLGASLAADAGIRSLGPVSFLVNVVLNPIATFIYNYILRLGFLDGREGLLLHMYHSVYISWKYAKAWEMSRS